MKFSNFECNEIINYAESNLLQEWERIELKNSRYFIKEISEFSISQKVFKDYINENLSKYKIDNFEVFILKYIEGDFFGRHMDKMKTEFTQGAISNINTRLNDDYIGGDFYLNDLIHNKPIGEIYNYDSDVYHEVKPITSGTRYTLLCLLRVRNITKKITKSIL
jgi:predicted 2-oxoglutarate/Fe(II)-dependent dioxygenase YbiX